MAHYLSLIQSKVCDVGWLAPWVGWAAALGGSYPVPLLAHTLGTQQGLARLYVVDDGEDLVDVGHLLPHEGLQVLDLGVQPGVFLLEVPGLPPSGLCLLLLPPPHPLLLLLTFHTLFQTLILTSDFLQLFFGLFTLLLTCSQFDLQILVLNRVLKVLSFEPGQLLVLSVLFTQLDECSFDLHQLLLLTLQLLGEAGGHLLRLPPPHPLLLHLLLQGVKCGL